MEKQVYTVTAKDSPEYEITVYKGAAPCHLTYYELSYSPDQSAWVRPGEKILTIIDTGDNIEVKPKLKKIVDYDKFAEFLILSSFIKSQDKGLMADYKVIEKIVVTEI